MAVSHVKTVTVADGTATSVVRPSDWNSGHLQYMTLGGNTAGASTLSGANIVLAGGSNVTLSAAGSTVSVIGPPTSQFLTTAANSTHSHGNPALYLTNLSGTTGSNSAGLSLSLSAANPGGGGGPAISAGTNSQSSGTVVFSNANGVTFGMDTNGIVTATVTPGAAAGIAAITASNMTATSGTVGFVGSNAVTVKTSAGNVIVVDSPVYQTVGAYLTTAAQSNHSHGNPTLALTNLSGTTASASNGLTISLSAGAGGAGDGGNILAAAGSTANSTGTIVFSNANGISFGLNGGTMTASYMVSDLTVSNNLTISAGTGASSTNATIFGPDLTQYLTTAALSNHSHGNPTLYLTNLTGTTASASNGLSMSLSAASPGGGGVAVAGSNTTYTSGTVVFTGSNAATVKSAAGQIVIDVPTQTNQVVTGYATSNVVGNSSGTFNASSMILRGIDQLSVGFSNGSIQFEHGGADPLFNRIAASNSTAPAGSTVIFSNSNNISFGITNGSQMTASVNAQVPGAYLTTARASNDAVGLATAATSVTWTVNSGGISLNAGAYLTTAQPVGAYLTTARASNDGIGLNTALTANGVAWTVNSSGLSLSVPAFLTTALQSQMTSAFMSTSERANYFATNAFTFANSTHSHGNPTLALTGINGTTASASNGLTLSLSAVGGGGAAISAAGSSQNAGTVVFSNSNGVSFGMNGSTITASVNAGGAGATHSYFDPYGHVVRMTGQIGQSSIYLCPVVVPYALSFDRVVCPVSYTNTTNSSNSFFVSMRIALYTNNVGSLSLAHSSSSAYQTTNSGTVGAMTGWLGIKNLTVGWSTSIPAGQYWLAVHSITTTSGGAGMSMSQMLVSTGNSAMSGILGAAPATSNQLRYGQGVWNAQTAAFPNSIGFTAIAGSASGAQRPPYVYFTNGSA